MSTWVTHKAVSAYARLFARPRFARIHYLLLGVALRGLGILNYYDSAVSGEKYFVEKILPKLIQNNNPIFFDVGANRGDYSVILATRFPHARIFAFEPHPKNYQSLLRERIQNTVPLELALGSTAGEARLYDRIDIDGSTKATLYSGVINEIHHMQAIAHVVKVSTLAAVTESQGVGYIDFLKIDTEGHELSILQGGNILLEQDRIGVIQFEFNEMNTISHSLFYDFRRILHNFTLLRLLPHGLLAIPESPLFSEVFAYQNILAVSKNKFHLL